MEGAADAAYNTKNDGMEEGRRRVFGDRRAGAECVARQSLQRKRAVLDVAATGDLHQRVANCYLKSPEAGLKNRSEQECQI